MKDDIDEYSPESELKQSIYLDYNATTPIAREVSEAMLPFLYEHFGNPSSGHLYGMTAKRAIEAARTQVAALINCSPLELIFTSGGTESNNYALKGAAFARQGKGNHIIASAVEHPSVLEVCRWLEGQGFRITLLPVDAFGIVSPADLEQAITADTILVSVMHANNEVGTIQPIAALAEIAHRRGALMHTDAAQSLGKIVVDVNSLDVDLLTIAGHKLYAPKGIGALYVRKGVELVKQTHGAGQEFDSRPGTENVLEIVGLGKACELAQRDLTKDAVHFREMRDLLQQSLLDELGEESVRVNGHPSERLPNTLSISFRGVESNILLAEIGEKVAASAGSACHTGRVEVSSVLKAMQTPTEWAMGTVRFSVGRATNVDEINQAVKVVSAAVDRWYRRLEMSNGRTTPR